MSVPVNEHPGFRCLADQAKAELTPAQQVALLTLYEESQRWRTLASAVLQKLKSSTARSGFPDILALAERRYAIRGSDGRHAITGLGKVVAGALARELAKEYDIELWPQRRPPPRRRGIFGPGFSQAGNA